ncbi:unnamed protein product [Durusdinium trenchii]|uniref:Protochlorophyllide reductase n=1 Tax=Durusdinium trenchii TaxID=1381693 RepID=A0ABP0PNX5_9DINO
MQALLPRLRAGGGRVLHLGTSVAFQPQKGTATYGITKAAFHRLYQQLNAEDLAVPVGSLSPGLVDTEGVQDHVAKARRLELPHVKYFDQAFEKGWTTDMKQLMAFVDYLLQLPAEEFTAREWRFSEWRKQVEAISFRAPSGETGETGETGAARGVWGGARGDARSHAGAPNDSHWMAE